MNITIGENIKRLRKNKNITQEELANLFNITPAAVCKWETNDSYPDITLLMPLAYYFGVSIDELIGYDETQLQEEINNIIKKYWELYFLNPIEATKLINKAYIKYSNNCDIMHLYMWDKAGGNADNDHKILLEHKDEFLDICEKIIKNTNNITLVLNTWNMRAKILHAEGKTEEALLIYENKYPNFYHTSNQKKEQLYAKNTDEFSYYLSLNILELTDFLINKRMKQIWFVYKISVDEKIQLSLELIEIVSSIRNKYSYTELILAEYEITNELIDYLNRFNIKKDELLLEDRKNKIIKECNILSKDNPFIKEYIKKAYQKEKL